MRQLSRLALFESDELLWALPGSARLAYALSLSAVASAKQQFENDRQIGHKQDIAVATTTRRPDLSSHLSQASTPPPRAATAAPVARPGGIGHLVASICWKTHYGGVKE